MYANVSDGFAHKFLRVQSTVLGQAAGLVLLPAFFLFSCLLLNFCFTDLPSPTADPTTPPPVAEFVDPKHEVVLIESDPVNVTCRARNAVSVGLINADTGTVIDKKTVGDPATDTTLVWSSEITNMRHAGRYRCEAADSRGILVSHNFTVVVKRRLN